MAKHYRQDESGLVTITGRITQPAIKAACHRSYKGFIKGAVVSLHVTGETFIILVGLSWRSRADGYTVNAIDVSLAHEDLPDPFAAISGAIMRETMNVTARSLKTFATVLQLQLRTLRYAIQRYSREGDAAGQYLTASEVEQVRGILDGIEAAVCVVQSEHSTIEQDAPSEAEQGQDIGQGKEALNAAPYGGVKERGYIMHDGTTPWDFRTLQIQNLIEQSHQSWDVGGVVWHQLKEGQKVVIAMHNGSILTVREMPEHKSVPGFALFSEDEDNTPFPAGLAYGSTARELVKLATQTIARTGK